jgi:protein-disulfide isomerase
MRLIRTFAAALLLFSAIPGLHAQATAGQPPFTPFKDKKLLMDQLPAGQKVALLEFEDLECPACAHAAPIVKQAIDKYKIPYLRHDFLIPGHFWSKDAAITARYLQDKVSTDLAEQYRRDVFASQMSISSKDDLDVFTRRWFQNHKQMMPFVMDPVGRFAAEVQADCTMGDRIGLIHTPTIVVLTPRGWTEVTDVTQLYSVLDRATGK